MGFGAGRRPKHRGAHCWALSVSLKLTCGAGAAGAVCNHAARPGYCRGTEHKAGQDKALNAAAFARREIAQFLCIRISTSATRSFRARLLPASPPPQWPAKPEPWPIRRLLDAGFSLLADCALCGEDAFAYSARAAAEERLWPTYDKPDRAHFRACREIGLKKPVELHEMSRGPATCCDFC